MLLPQAGQVKGLGARASAFEYWELPTPKQGRRGLDAGAHA